MNGAPFIGILIAFLVVIFSVSVLWYGTGYKNGFRSATSKNYKIKYIYEVNKEECYIEIDGFKYKTDCNQKLPYSIIWEVQF